jgi:hypothetical protein
MVRNALHLFSIAIAASVSVTLSAVEAGAQCLKCTTTITQSGTLKCDVDPTSAGYRTCSCPCECEDACGQGGVAATFEQLLVNPGMIPDEGAEVVGFDPLEYTSVVTSASSGHALQNRAAYLATGFGLVELANGTWQAYRLSGSGEFQVRDCRGRMIATVRAAPEAAPSADELLASLT